MAIHPHQIIVPTRVNSNRVLAVFKAAVVGLLGTIRIDADVVSGSGNDVGIDVTKNGSVVASIIWNSSTLTHTFTGLGITVAVGDKIGLQTTSGFGSFFYMGPLLYVIAYVDDAQPSYFGGTSATSFAIGTGSKAFTVNSASLAYTVGNRVRIASSASPTTNYMEGIVTAYVGTTLTVLVDTAAGSSTHTDWLFGIGGEKGDTGATGATGSAGPTGPAATVTTGTIASSATPTPDSANDSFTVTALAAGATFAAPTGSPVNGQPLLIRIKDNATARSLAWNAIYRAIGTTLPTTTVVSKTTYVGCVYNSTDNKWDVLGVNTEA